MVLKSFHTGSWKEDMNFPNPPSLSTSSTKQTNPDSSRSPLPPSEGHHSLPAPRGPPTQLSPSTISAISRAQKRPARRLDQKMSPMHPTTDLAKAGTDTRNPAPPLPAPFKGKAPPLMAQPARGSRTHGGSLRQAPRRGVSLGLRQPPTDSGVSSIITPLSLWICA